MLQIVYENGKPHGIRNDDGFLFLFTRVQRYTGQEERYRQEIKEQRELADYLFNALRDYYRKD